MKTIFQRKGFKIIFFLIISVLFAFIGNESKAFTCGTDTVSYGGKNYTTVLIGTQCWFRENLNVGTMLASGATMPDNTAPTLNDPSTVQKWCYNNDSAICNTDGGLHTWAETNALANSCNTTTCTPYASVGREAPPSPAVSGSMSISSSFFMACPSFPASHGGYIET